MVRRIIRRAREALSRTKTLDDAVAEAAPSRPLVRRGPTSSIHLSDLPRLAAQAQSEYLDRIRHDIVAHLAPKYRVNAAGFYAHLLANTPERYAERVYDVLTKAIVTGHALSTSSALNALFMHGAHRRDHTVADAEAEFARLYERVAEPRGNDL